MEKGCNCPQGDRQSGGVSRRFGGENYPKQRSSSQYARGSNIWDDDDEESESDMDMPTQRQRGQSLSRNRQFSRGGDMYDDYECDFDEDDQMGGGGGFGVSNQQSRGGVGSRFRQRNQGQYYRSRGVGDEDDECDFDDDEEMGVGKNYRGIGAGFRSRSGRFSGLSRLGGQQQLQRPQFSRGQFSLGQFSRGAYDDDESDFEDDEMQMWNRGRGQGFRSKSQRFGGGGLGRVSSKFRSQQSRFGPSQFGRNRRSARGVGGYGNWDDEECDTEYDDQRRNRSFSNRRCGFGDEDEYGQRRNRPFSNRRGGFADEDECDFDEVDEISPWKTGRGSGNRVGFRSQKQQSRSPRSLEKKQIVKDLLTDRQRDQFQSHIIFHLLSERQANRNRLPLLKSLIAGEQVSKKEIFELLCEDLVLDRITDEIVYKIILDHVKNRFADGIIENLGCGEIHLPHEGQRSIENMNARVDKVFAKLALKVTHPQAIKKVIKTGIVEDLMEYLASGESSG